VFQILIERQLFPGLSQKDFYVKLEPRLLFWASPFLVLARAEIHSMHRSRNLKACSTLLPLSITPIIDSKMTTTPGAVTPSSKQSQVMGSFASLISCALNATDSGVRQPFKSSAVQLPFFISASQDSSTSCCSVSSLQLRQHKAVLSSRSSKPLLQDAAASNLCHPLEFRKSELQGLPMKLLWNVSQSFMSLVDSRLRSSLAALEWQSSGEKDTLTPVLVGLLGASSNPINPTTIVTTFRTLASSEHCANGDYMQPLILEIVIDLNVLGNTVAVTVEAPGTVRGDFSCNTEEAGPAGLLKVDIQIDTAALLVSMMAQARLAVRKAVGFATELASQILLPASSNTVSSNSSVHSMESVCKGKVVEETLPASGSENDLMPPPPARARSSTSLLETNEKKISSSSNNHSWDEQGGKVEKGNLSGLNLMSTALSGLKRDCDDNPSDPHPASKKQRAATLSDVKGVDANSAADTETTTTSKASTDQEHPSSHAGDDSQDISTMAKV
jgi:hypothetical protein